MKYLITLVLTSTLFLAFSVSAATEAEEQIAKALAKKEKLEKLQEKRKKEYKACQGGNASSCIDYIDTTKKYEKESSSKRIACNGPDCGDLPTIIGPDGNPIIDPNIIIMNLDDATVIQNKMKAIEGVDIERFKAYMKNENVIKEFKSLGIIK